VKTLLAVAVALVLAATYLAHLAGHA